MIGCIIAVIIAAILVIIITVTVLVLVIHVCCICCKLRKKIELNSNQEPSGNVQNETQRTENEESCLLEDSKWKK